MDPLVDELLGTGQIDDAGLRWAIQHGTAHGIGVQTALLELDLVDEPELVRALASVSALPVATVEQLADVDPELRSRLPADVLASAAICPLRVDGDELVVLVDRPLPDPVVERLDAICGMPIRQVMAPAHHLAMAASRLRGVDPDPGAARLEARLERRRRTDVAIAIERGRAASTFGAAVRGLFEHGGARFDFICIVARRGRSFRWVAPLGSVGPGDPIALPGPDGPLATVLRHGGYFVGAPPPTAASRAVFAALGRDLPRSAVVIPIPTAFQTALVCIADNADRGVAPRWVAELTLLASWLGKLDRNWDAWWDALDAEPEEAVVEPEPPVEAATATDVEPPAVAEPPPPAVPGRVVSDAEWRALERLREAARSAGETVDQLVDRLLRAPERPQTGETTSALVGELKGLFEQLAVAIPAQLARGMEAAFRDMSSRGGVAPAPAPSPPAASAVALVAPVPVTETEREVPAYNSRRRKMSRVKL